MKSSLQAFSKLALGLWLAFGVTGAVAANVQPAQADVVVSFGGGGYASEHHWYHWRDRDGWHRQWVRAGWVRPVAFVPAYAYGPVYARPEVWRHDRDRDWDRERDRDHRDWR